MHQVHTCADEAARRLETRTGSGQYVRRAIIGAIRNFAMYCTTTEYAIRNSLLVTRHIRFRRIPPDTQQRIGRDVAGERH
jgi:hypothetical protein